MRLFPSGSGTVDNSFLIPRTNNGAAPGEPRVLVADGRTCVSVQTLMRQINILYKKLGFTEIISSKSAKVLGVSTAFFLGMTDDEVRILGRWKDISTSQYYRSIDHTTLLNIFSKLHLSPETKHDSSHSVIKFSSFSDRLVGLSSCCKSVILSAYNNHSCQPTNASLSSNVIPTETFSSHSALSSQTSTLTWLLNTGWVWPAPQSNVLPVGQHFST